MILSALLLLALRTGPALGGEIFVGSMDELVTAIGRAEPGDRVVLADGKYLTTDPIVVGSVGEPARPIVIAAQSVGGVEIAGEAGFTLTGEASHVHVVGFTFTHRAGGNRVEHGATHCRFSRNTFVCSGTGNYLLVAGDDTQVDFNTFRDKHTVGNMIDVRGGGETGQVARWVHIHHNYFHDFKPAGGNGAETIRFGLSSLSLSEGAGLVEFNLFERCRGENELISNKSCANTYRYNTFKDSPGSELCLRHGNRCVVYGNTFHNTDGMRIYGDGHTVFSNCFVGNSTGIEIGNGGGEVADGAALTTHDRPDGCVIVFNTFVDNRRQFMMPNRRNGLGATATTFANNVLIGPGVAVSIDQPASYTDPQWAGNLVWGTGRVGDLPATGYQRVDPLLADASDGVRGPAPRLQPGSPAINRPAGSYPRVTVDIDGQTRDSKPDAGADEVTDGPQFARVLTSDDVGAMAAASAPFDPDTPADSEPGDGVIQLALTPVPGDTIRHVQWFEVTTAGDVPVGGDEEVLRLVNNASGVRRFYCMVLTDRGTFSSRTAVVRRAR